MTRASDRLANALAIWPLDREQVSLLREAIAEIDDIRADALSVLLREAEQAVINCASLLARKTPREPMSQKATHEYRP